MPIRIAKIRSPCGAGNDPRFTLELYPERSQSLMGRLDMVDRERDLYGHQVGWIRLGPSPAQCDREAASVEKREVLICAGHFESKLVAIELDCSIQVRHRKNHDRDLRKPEARIGLSERRQCEK